MKRNTIFVVTPSLNNAETIERTIRSVISQCGNFHIRYHVQDGGSFDGTVEILRRWEYALAKPSPKIDCCAVTFTWASGRDGDMYDAILKGFDSMTIEAKAPMTWINGDDLLMPDAFATITRIFAVHPEIQWIGGSTRVVNENDQVILERTTPTPTDVIREGLCDGQHWYHLQQEGIFFKESLWYKARNTLRNYQLAGDWRLWREFAQHAPYHQIDKPLGTFRTRKGQLSIVRKAGYDAEIEATIPMSKRSEAFQLLYNRRHDLSYNLVKLTAGHSKAKIERKPVTAQFEKFMI